MTRIHVLLDEADKERFRRQAEREGKSLSAWLRDVALQRLAALERRTSIATVTELDAFFSACDAREHGREPDWNEHRRVIEESKRSGLAEA